MLTPQPLSVNLWQSVLQHALADYYPTRCMVAFDESQVSRNAADATRGRGPRGQPATGWQVPSKWPSVLRTVFGVITVRGMDMSACDVIEGPIDDDKFYYEFFLPKFLPALQPFDDRVLDNRCERSPSLPVRSTSALSICAVSLVSCLSSLPLWDPLSLSYA